MKLVELVFPAAVAQDTRARAHALCEDLGKTAVEVPDIPGFVVNRLLFPTSSPPCGSWRRPGCPRPTWTRA
jgi:3-hydroxyacyl-CoA dehydrogenase